MTLSSYSGADMAVSSISWEYFVDLNICQLFCELGMIAWRIINEILGCISTVKQNVIFHPAENWLKRNAQNWQNRIGEREYILTEKLITNLFVFIVNHFI